MRVIKATRTVLRAIRKKDNQYHMLDNLAMVPMERALKVRLGEVSTRV